MKFTKRLKLIAEKLSALMMESYLSERAKRGSRGVRPQYNTVIRQQ
jgi:hypothetical protein